MAAGAGIVAYFEPGKTNLFPVCPLFAMTGLACPGCGMTRGFHSLFHGDVLAALDYNALLPIAAVMVGYLFVSLVTASWRGRGLSWNVFRPAVLWSVLAVTIVFAVVRNIPIYPFNVLYP
jgi:hypothetical protein